MVKIDKSPGDWIFWWP